MKRLGKFFQLCIVLVLIVLIIRVVIAEFAPDFAPRFNESYNTQRRAMGIPIIDDFRVNEVATNEQMVYFWKVDTVSVKPSHLSKTLKREGWYTNSESDFYAYGAKKDNYWTYKTTYNWVTTKVVNCTCEGTNGDNMDTCRARLKILMERDTI